MRRSRPAIACVAGLAAAVIAGAVLWLVLAPTPLAAAQGTQPNVLLIITDDQPTGLMRSMPQTRRIFGARGVRFSNAYVTTPRCCPSRASIFTGQYAHNHGVWDNKPPHDASNFDASETWQHELDADGYFTGIIGKYFNGEAIRRAPWFDFRQRSDAKEPDEAAQEAGLVGDFLSRSERRDARPWALVLATHSPHAPWNAVPAEPFPFPKLDPAPSYNESNLSDKAPRVRRAAARLNPDYPAAAYAGQSTELEATDELVGAVWQALRDLREHRQTLAIYISDNGFMYGEHRLSHKSWPYLESVGVPLFIRWHDRLAAGTVDSRLTANIDLAPTILDAVGITPRYLQPDGRSLLGPDAREWLLLEGPAVFGSAEVLPGFMSYLSLSRQYIEWPSGWVEDYDLTSDPWQLRASNKPQPPLAEAISDASGCAGALCP